MLGESRHHVKITGGNFVGFFNALIKHNLELHSATRPNPNTLLGVVSHKHLAKLKSLTAHMGLKLEIAKTKGWLALLTAAKYRVGMVVGIVLSVALIILLNQFTFNYKILGLQNISADVIERQIADFGVKKYAINTIDCQHLERHLSDNIPDISMVSVVKKGTTLIVNIKEKLSVITEHPPIVAPYNMLITGLDIHAGFTTLKVGDSVLKGQTIVHPHTFDGAGNVVHCQPVATVEGMVWFSQSYTLPKQEEVLVRTGKTITTHAYSLGNKTLFKTGKPNTFEHFETSEKTYPITNLFLPLTYTKTTYYQCQKQTLHHDIEKEKSQIIQRLLAQTKQQIPPNILYTEENVVISNYQYKHVISVYLQATISIKGNS